MPAGRTGQPESLAATRKLILGCGGGKPVRFEKADV